MYLVFTLFAYFLNSIVVLIDKALVSKTIGNPLTYIFYISLVSLLACIIIPFTVFPGVNAFIFASISTLLWTMGEYFMFHALKTGHASRVVPVIGTISPLALVLYYGFFAKALSTNQTWAVGLLVSSLLFLTLPNLKGKLSMRELLFEVVSALSFASSYVILKMAYDGAPFLAVLAYSRLILIPLAIIILVIPLTRAIVLAKSENGKKYPLLSKTGLLFALGQLSGGSSELLLTFSISLATPALVNSLQGSVYVFIFIFSLILSRFFPKIFDEKYSVWSFIGKVFGIAMISLGLYILALSEQMPPIKVVGLNFSPRYARDLGLEPKTAYINILDALKPRSLRLQVYWNESEKSRGQYDFSSTDYYLNIASNRNISVIMQLGFKSPRWPECFAPDWTKSLSRDERDAALIKYIEAGVNHFKTYKNITIWQIENEPLIPFVFGDCPARDDITRQTLIKEIALTKSLDPRPVMVTDSGEISTWWNTANATDKFGISLYRTVWNDILKVVLYPIPPIFYTIHGNLLGKNADNMLITELQAEPWGINHKSLPQLSNQEIEQLFPPQQLKSNFEFARETNFSEIYFWGAEWWYLRSTQGDNRYMDAAKQIFSTANEKK